MVCDVYYHFHCGTGPVDVARGRIEHRPFLPKGQRELWISLQMWLHFSVEKYQILRVSWVI